MSLQKRLAALRESSAKNIPAEAKAVMSRAIENLRNSGIVEKMLEVGAPAPKFELVSSTGETISLEGELAKGPVLLTFFRGSW